MSHQSFHCLLLVVLSTTHAGCVSATTETITKSNPDTVPEEDAGTIEDSGTTDSDAKAGERCRSRRTDSGIVGSGTSRLLVHRRMPSRRKDVFGDVRRLRDELRRS